MIDINIFPVLSYLINTDHPLDDTKVGNRRSSIQFKNAVVVQKVRLLPEAWSVIHKFNENAMNVVTGKFEPQTLKDRELYLFQSAQAALNSYEEHHPQV